jgi:glucose/arabinose dehydrogenase
LLQKEDIVFLLSIFIIILSFVNSYSNYVVAQPFTLDRHFKVEHVFTGAFKSTNMAFIGPSDVIILDRDGGKVYRIVDWILNQEPLLNAKVATVGYRGLLGVDAKVNEKHIYVFLYYTEAVRKDGDDEIDNGNVEPLGNRLYRYELIDEKLVNQKLLLDLPVNPGPRHAGGEIGIGPDNNIYLTMGDLDGTFNERYDTLAQNYNNGTMIDGRSGILRVTAEGKPVDNGIIGNKFPLNLYFAYGIRNSFGITWDPLTKNLWDTENGPHFGNEINLVEPGFNSGWVKVQGVWKPRFDEMGELSLNPAGLVSFNGTGKYSEPEFVWIPTIAPTALKFFTSDKYGPDYKNDLFVGDANTGTVYHFELNENRTALQLKGKLIDRIADNMNELKGVTFASGFGRITDMQIGMDGYLYVLSSSDAGASIDRIIPNK